MSNCLDDLTCPGGNCVGCKDGKVWCQDPRCQPNCQNCAIDKDHDFNASIVMLVIVLCLIAILFIVWFIWGPTLFEPHEDHERANVVVPQKDLPQKTTEVIC